MKIKVTNEFKDKHTGKMHKIGDELEVSVERLNEILSVGAFVKVLETETKTEEKTEAKTETTAAKKTAAKKTK